MGQGPPVIMGAPSMVGVPPQQSFQRSGVSNQPSVLGRRPPSTSTSDLGFLPASNKRSKNNNDGGGDSDEDEDEDLFNDNAKEAEKPAELKEVEVEHPTK